MQNLSQKKSGLIVTLSVLSLISIAACSSAVTPSSDQASDKTATTGNPQTAPEVGGAASTGTATIFPATETGEPPVSDEVKELLESQDQLNLLVTKGDVAGCKALAMAQFQVSCETNILVNKAKSKDDLAVCDTASNEEIKTNCRGLIEKKEF